VLDSEPGCIQLFGRFGSLWTGKTLSILDLCAITHGTETSLVCLVHDSIRRGHRKDINLGDAYPHNDQRPMETVLPFSHRLVHSYNHRNFVQRSSAMPASGTPVGPFD
jgi:hypothetical protein